MRKLTLAKGVVLYDDDDEPIVASRKWHVSDTGYAVWRRRLDGRKQTVRLHRVITSAPDGMVVDHLNHNKLDNRRANLRVCSQSDNMRNLTNQGKGYWFQKQNNNWVVEINNRHIGVFATEVEASRVASVVRAGGRHVKPVRTQCKYGHSLNNAYNYNGNVNCKRCQSIRSAAYYKRKKERIAISAEQ